MYDIYVLPCIMSIKYLHCLCNDRIEMANSREREKERKKENSNMIEYIKCPSMKHFNLR